MKQLFAAVFAAAQYLSFAVGLLLTGYLLYRWNVERSIDPAFNGFNPWVPGIIAFCIGTVFKYARKGIGANESKPPGKDA